MGRINKQWSVKYTRQFVFFVLFFVIVLAMALFMLSAGMRCVGKDGCLREHCEYNLFKSQYKTLIKESNNGNEQCRFSTSDEEALILFNSIKDTYSSKIEELNELKRQVFQSDQIDQQQRSKLRISIESLLIDLNEEIFSISEELAKSFTFERQKNLYQKALEFEQRKNNLLKKIKETIDNNQSVKIIRRQVRIANLSPPQKDLNTFGLQTQDSERLQIKQNTQKKSKSPVAQLKRNFSSQKMNNESYDMNQSNNDIRTVDSNKPKQSQRNSIIKKKKSPIPLRRIQDPSQSLEARRFSNSSTRKNNSAKKQLFTHEPRDTKRDQKLKRNIKKLEEFEKYLAKKNGGADNKENKDSVNENVTQSQYSTVQLQSEAFETFAQEFQLMKNKLLQMQSRLTNQEDKTNLLEDQVEKLKTENLKLTTDVKIIRNEHSEILHTLYNLEKKNNQLQSENQILKRILSGEREQKGQESNLPKQLNDREEASFQDNSRQERKPSPFNSFLHKNRSFSHLRESKDSNTSLTKNPNSDFNGTQKAINLKQIQQSDFMSFQPSTNQNYQQFGAYSQEREQTQTTQQQQQLQYHNVRSSLRNMPSSFHHNPLLSMSNERGAPTNTNNSYLGHQQQTTLNNQSKANLSGPQSRRDEYNVYSRLNETPTTPDHIMQQMTDETPNTQNRLDDYIGRQRSFNVGTKRMTPTSSSQQMALGNGTADQSQLSDWVLERLNKK